MTFSTPRFFLAHEECFACDTVSWKLLAGTFQTNVSQVRLETYRNIPSGVSHGFTKAQGAMKPKTPFSLKQGDEIQNFNMRRRVIQKFVAGPNRAAKLPKNKNDQWNYAGGFATTISTSPSLKM